MLVKFTKMHGLGNDFMVVDCVRQKVFFSEEQIRRLGNRHFGVGFDQLLVVEPPFNPDLDFHYRIFNQDGSEVEMCGNGARCFMYFIRTHGLTNKDEVRVSTAAGEISLKLLENDDVLVDMGAPRFDPQSIKFDVPNEADSYELLVEDYGVVNIGAVSMGNPHAVIFCEDVKMADVAGLGAKIESHKRFLNKTNVNFVSKINAHEINHRVFERGCGETLACGSGACASVAVGIKQGLLESPVLVHLQGGDLHIRYENNKILMQGSASIVYEGEIEI